VSGFNSELRLVIKAVDNATIPLASMTRKLNVMAKTAERIGKPFANFGSALKGFGEKTGLVALGKSVGDVGSAVGTVAKRFAGLATVAGAGLYAVIHSSVEAGDKLSEMSKRTGIAVDTYAALQYSAAQADVEQEQFNAAMDKFNRNLGAAKAGGGSLLTLLNKISPALALQVKGAKSTSEALGLMTEAFTKTTDTGKRAELSGAAFGRSGLQVGTWLAQGTSEIQKQSDAYILMVGSQKRYAAESDNLDNTLRDSKMAFLGVRNVIATELFPVVGDLAKELTKFLVSSRSEISRWARESATLIRAWVKGGGLRQLKDDFLVVAHAVASVVRWLGPTKTAVAGVTAVSWPLVNALGGLSFNMIAVAVKAAPMLVQSLGWIVTTALPVVGVLASMGAAAGMLWAIMHPAETSTFLGTMLREIDALKPAFAWLDDKVKGIDAEVNKKLGITPGHGRNINNLTREQRDQLGAQDTRAILDNGLSPAGLLKSGTAWWGNQLPSQKWSHGTDAAAIVRAPPTAETKVTVDFVNAPKGTRVKPEPSSVDFDWSLGFSNQ
jgi:hypothetical protein